MFWIEFIVLMLIIVWGTQKRWKFPGNGWRHRNVDFRIYL